MNIIIITKENLEKEHICCAISNNNDCQVSAKKVWLAERLDDGLVFKKAQNAPAPFTSYSLFYNGEFITNEILSEKKFEKIITDKEF